MAKSSNYEKLGTLPFSVSKWHEYAADLEADNRRDSKDDLITSFMGMNNTLNDENDALRAKNVELRKSITDNAKLSLPKTPAQELKDEARWRPTVVVLREELSKLEAEKEELEKKLAGPLIDKDTIKGIVKSDEKLKAQRLAQLEDVFDSIRAAHENEMMETMSQEEWCKSIWDWQKQKDDGKFDWKYSQDGVKVVREWTAQEIWTNRAEERHRYRERRVANLKAIAESKLKLEEFDEAIVRLWRDVVLGELGKEAV